MFESGKQAGWQKANGNSDSESATLQQLIAAIYAPVLREWWQHQPVHIQDELGFTPDFINGEDQFPPCPITDKTHGGPATAAFLPHEQVDFLYTRVWSTERADHRNWLGKMSARLKSGGIWLIAFMPLSGFMTYPNNHAFARVMELISLLEEADGMDSGEPLPMSIQLAQTGFRSLNTGHAHPAFLQQGFHSIPSLLLQWHQADFLRFNLAKSVELDALLPELQQFERVKNSLISRPGMFQVLAQKSPAPHN